MNPEQPYVPLKKLRPNVFLIAGIALGVLLMVSTAVLIWLYVGAKSDLDDKIAQAVSDREATMRLEITAQFEEEAKLPYKTLTFAESLGGITLSVPKTWNVYADQSDSSTTPLDFYAHPNYVPSEDSEIAYAFRVQITTKDYAEAIKQYQTAVGRGTLIARPAESNGVLGTTYTGAIEKDIDGALTALPLRDKTILLWTESNASYGSDYQQILSAVIFAP